MDKREANKILCAVLSTLSEVDGAPESILYMGIGADMGRWETIRGFMLAGHLVTIEGNYVRLTEYGKEIAGKVNAMVAA